LLCIPILTFPSGDSLMLSGQTVVVLFIKDGERVTYPIEWVKYSQTIKNMLDEIGSVNAGTVIPIDGIDSAVFNCLMALVNRDKRRELRIEALPIDAMRTRFKEKMRDDQWEMVSLKELLIAANYLDLRPETIKTVIASLYADTLKDKRLEPTYFSDIPPDCYKLIGGWLLHDLLMEKGEHVWKNKDLLFMKHFPLLGLSKKIVVSSSSTSDGFGIIWPEQTFFEWIVGYRSLKRLYVNFFDEGIPHIAKKSFNFSKYNVSEDILAYALSSDCNTSFVLCLNAGNDRNMKGIILPSGIVIDFKGIIDDKIVFSKIPQHGGGSGFLLFNESANSFCIIVDKGEDASKTSKNILLYEVFPDGTTKKTDHSVVIPEYMRNNESFSNGRWYSIGEYFVGQYICLPDKKPNLILFYKKNTKELFGYYKDSTKAWVSAEKREEFNMQFDIVGISAKKNGLKYDEVVMPASFIPYFGTILRKCNMNSALGYYDLSMNLQSYGTGILQIEHLRMIFLNSTDNRFAMRYFFPPRLTQAIIALNNQAQHTAEHLYDICLLYNYYEGTLTRELLYMHLSLPFIKSLYKPSMPFVQPASKVSQFAGSMRSALSSLRYNPGQFFVAMQQRMSSLSSLSPFYKTLGVAGISGFAVWLKMHSAKKP
jgi:hypothetical protein